MIDLQSVREQVVNTLFTSESEASTTRASLFFDENILDLIRFGVKEYVPENIWSRYEDRSYGRYTHGLIFFQDWMRMIQDDPTGNLAERALEVAETWIDAYHFPANPVDTMSFHDETTAQRLLTFLRLETAAASVLPNERLMKVRRVSDETADLLARDTFHSTGNNHGMFQDISLRNYSVLADWRESEIRTKYFEISCRRLKDYFYSCFTSEGVHVENTPTYHVMVSQHLAEHANLLRLMPHPDESGLSNLLDNAESFATHAVMPGGVFPPISDTQQLSLAHRSKNLYKLGYFRFAATNGQFGKEPPSNQIVLPESGYALYRTKWRDPMATFVAFQAAYNADYHKHSDDLSIFIRHAGADLISEAGPHGYNYKDPFTRYGYSQYAHNNIVVNGRSVNRTDKKSASVTLKVVEERHDGFTVEGQTGRLHETTHSRQLDVARLSDDHHPTVTVIDQVYSERHNSYELLWNIGTDIDVVGHGQGFELFQNGKKLMDCHFEANVATTLSVHNGETMPKPLGWRFPKFSKKTATNVVVVRFAGKNARVTTTFRFENFHYRDRGLALKEHGWARSSTVPSLNYLLKKGKKADGKLFVVFSAIGEIGDFTYNYKATIDKHDVNCLYILDDFGDQGSYYLQDHGDRSIFAATQNLISKVANDINVSDKDIITIGSSKGGAAAIIHGIAVGSEHIVAGAPQIKIGSFLRSPHPNVLEFMTGSTSDADREALDDTIFEFLRTARTRSKIHVIVGEDDHHYRGHAVPLADAVKQSILDLFLVVVPGMPHDQIGGVFRHVIDEVITQVVEGKQIEISERWKARLECFAPASLRIIAPLRAGFEISYRLFKDNLLYASVPYGQIKEYVWEGLPSGKYRVRVYNRRLGEQDNSAYTTVWAHV